MQFTLFELQVKALVQPLGNEDAWSELGDGRLEMQSLTIRVVTPAPEVPTVTDVAGQSILASSMSPQVILEDNIAEDTPFVGENNCIVWNSLDQGVSLCIMFSSDLSFRAAWSALAAMQHKSSVPLEVDLFANCCSDEPADLSSGANNESAADASPTVPYRSLLHSSYCPPLGFIEKHSMASSLVEYRHMTNPALFDDKEVCETLLKLGNADLVESLVHPAVYPIFAKRLDPQCSIPAEWQVPEGIQETIQVGEDLVVCLRTVLYLHHLRHYVLPIGIDEEIVGVVDGVQHRLLNELACGLLSDDKAIKQAIQALHVIPSAASPSARPSRSTTPTEPLAVYMAPEAAEKHVANHLRFLSSVISLCMTAFSKELVAPVMSKVFSHGLLEALSRVAERYTVVLTAPRSLSQRNSPENAAVPPPLPTSTSSTTASPNAPLVAVPPRRPSTAVAVMRSSLVEAEMVKLLDCCIVRLNERQEELTLNDLFRGPIVDSPSSFTGILSFLVRQLKDHSIDESQTAAVVVHRGVGTNQFLLYHLLGLHDDEGSSSTERNMEPEHEAKRRDFVLYVVRHYIAPSCKTERDDKVSSSSSSCSSVFLRVLEYLLRLGSVESQELILSAVVDDHSTVLSYMDRIIQLSLRDRHAVAQDVLCGFVRFLREVCSLSLNALSDAVTARFDAPSLNVATNELSGTELSVPPPKLDRQIATRAISTLFGERDTISLLLKAYQQRGGERRKSLFHSTVLSFLQGMRNAPPSSQSRDVKTLLLARDRALLPPVLLKSLEADVVEDVLLRLRGSKLTIGITIDKRAASPMSHGNMSTTSAGAHSPGGSRFLHVDEMANPPDARQLEDHAAFPKRLRQAIGRLSPTPRGGLPEEELVSPARELPPIPHMSSPLTSALASPKGLSLLSNSRSLSPLPEQQPLLPPSAAASESNAKEGSGSGQTGAAAVKPTQPKQAKGNTGRSGVGKHLNDGKPKVK